ncbi:MAG: hypothetical protein QM569_14865 [Acidovorax sp.]|uniref:hypothetical protein n=1 Tax=Acidovorax sp. TaxID=1872122 RepID=UPI0039E5E926
MTTKDDLGLTPAQRAQYDAHRRAAQALRERRHADGVRVFGTNPHDAAAARLLADAAVAAGRAKRQAREAAAKVA